VSLQIRTFSQFPAQDLPAITGSAGPFPEHFSRELIRQLGATQVDDKKMTDAERASRWQASYEALMAFAPGEPIEAMLAAQAIAAHTAVLECLRRAMIAFTPEATCARLRANAVSLMRGGLAIMRHLEEHRRLTAARPRRP
jgi:hypothetical protein